MNLTLFTIDEFTEVFDDSAKETIYVSTSHDKSEEFKLRTEQGLEIPAVLLNN